MKNWGLGIGDWGLGIGDCAQSPIPKKNLLKILCLYIYFNKTKI